MSQVNVGGLTGLVLQVGQAGVLVQVPQVAGVLQVSQRLIVGQVPSVLQSVGLGAQLPVKRAADKIAPPISNLNDVIMFYVLIRIDYKGSYIFVNRAYYPRKKCVFSEKKIFYMVFC